MLTPGTLLGERYEIIEKIGAGGMSIVYKAIDNRLQRYVAIKELREEFVQDEEFVTKFRKEALSAASLSHPNIVGIYDVGSDKESHYIVMEYVEGKTLKQVIEEEGPFDAKTVLELGVQMVSALKHAHQKKIIHRDIKPQNILMTPEGVLKVTDFGIAKAVDSSTIVATGNAIGSVHYFSPEQAKGKYVNESSDLYSCGIVLFELATKRLPFEAESHISIALKHINEELPKPSSINPNIPSNLENIILRATCKNQADRYQNADEMLRDMRGVLQNPNYKVSMAYLNEKTILLSPEDTQLLRESEIEKNYDNAYEDHMTEEQESENIYVDEVGFDEEEDEGEVSTFYKVVVSVGGVLATLALVVVITLAAVFWIPSITKSKTYSVPNVVEKTQSEAEALITKNNLRVKVIEVETEEVLVGIVLEQSPVAGTAVKKNTLVEIQVGTPKAGAAEEGKNNSESEEELFLPDLSGMMLNDAMTELSKLGLRSESVLEFSDTVENGLVISQNPGANTKVKKDTKVELVISKGPKKEEGITVPSLYGSTAEEARKTLGSINLSLGSQSEEESEEPVGTIIRQSVAQGALVDAGTSINVTISKGPKENPEDKNQNESETPEEPPAVDEKPSEEETETTQSISVGLPEMTEVKDSYHVVVKLTLDDGKTSTKAMDVSHDQFPISVELTGKGTGVVDVFVDNVSVSQDSITF